MQLFYNHGQNANFPHISTAKHIKTLHHAQVNHIHSYPFTSCLPVSKDWKDVVVVFFFYVVSQVRASFQALGRPNADVAMGGADGPWMGTNVAQIDRFTRTK